MVKIDRESGFALVFELVLVALVLLIAAAAIYANAHHKNSLASSNVTQSRSPNPSHTPSASPSVSPSIKPTSGFDIPQLGFSMTLPEGLSGLVYSAQLNQSGSANVPYKVSSAWFSTQPLEQIDGTIYCSAADGPLGVISEYSASPSSLGITDYGYVKQVGTHYLAYHGPEAECSTNATANKLQRSLAQLLYQAFNTSASLP